MRWAIEIAAPAGPSGLTWGDWHFAQSLATSLRALDQDVVVDFREASLRTTGYLDDVRLVLRGLDVVQAQPGRVNMIWIISHPEDVTSAELVGHDRVFAAGGAWATSHSRRWNRPIETLLQCTDAHRFSPQASARTAPAVAPPVLFVGNSRNVYRPVVRAAVEAGVGLHVYGGRWAQFLGPDVVRAESLPNAALAGYYGTADVVLNDHWEDMRREGFMSNRLFDVVASGGVVLTDPVQGATELLGPSVQVWHSPEQLREQLAHLDQVGFPDAQGRLEAAERVGREHSFDARAAHLLEAATQVVAARGRGARRSS
jgi:hypothetical protein